MNGIGSSVRFGVRLRQIRSERGLSQRELAGLVGIDFTYLSKVENGHGDSPAEATIRRLAEALSADPDELLAVAGKILPAVRAKAEQDARFSYLLNALPSMTEGQLNRIYAAARVRSVPLPEDEANLVRSDKARKSSSRAARLRPTRKVLESK